MNSRRLQLWSVGTRRVAFVIILLTLPVVMGAWWADSRGYIPPLWEPGWGCSDVAYDPATPFEVLVEENDEHRYCARLIRDEAWF